MNDRLYVLVEGNGELEAAPALIRRLINEYHKPSKFDLSIKARSAKGNGNITRHLERMLAGFAGLADCKALLILLDAEKDHCLCPPKFARELAARVEAQHLRFPVAIVCACCEYESWFLVSLKTIADKWLVPNTTYRMANAVKELLTAIDENTNLVTPRSKASAEE